MLLIELKQDTDKQFSELKGDIQRVENKVENIKDNHFNHLYNLLYGLIGGILLGAILIIFKDNITSFLAKTK